MRPNDTLLIVGNGLDLNFNLPTSYGQFMEDKEVNKQLSETKLFNYLKSVKEAKNWVDIEKELYNYCQLMYNDPDSKKYDCHGGLRKEYMQLCEALKLYLKRVMHRSLRTNGIYAMSLVNDLCKSQENPLEVITFNYTNTLERISEHTNLKMKIHHIHGSLEDYDDIVFGIQDDVSDLQPQEVYLYKSYSKHKDLLPFRNLLPYYKRIVFYGYSLGDTDKQYFERFFKKLSNEIDNTRKISIYHYGRNAYDTVIWQLQSYTDNNLTGLELNHDVEFIDSQEQYQSPSFLM